MPLCLLLLGIEQLVWGWVRLSLSVDTAHLLVLVLLLQLHLLFQKGSINGCILDFLS